MTTLSHSAAFTERLLTRLRAQDLIEAAMGDFVIICTDKQADVWEIFPVRGVNFHGDVVAVEGEQAGTLAVSSINERPGALIGVPASDYPEPAALRALCWIPFTGLAPLRMRLQRLREAG